MRKVFRIGLGVVGVIVVVLAAGVFYIMRRDADRVIPGGGVHIAGWTDEIDARSAGQGRTLNDARFAQEAEAIHVTTGPATTYWNPANTATGDYTVNATFLEPQFMALNSHPHSYGIFIGGQNLGTDQRRLIYCVAYGSGDVLIRGFGPSVFTLLETTPNAAVHKAAAVGQPVTQEIAWHVKGNRAECAINGTVVAGFDRDELLGNGLQSTDGVYGIRFTHNVEAVITGFGMTKD